MQTRSKFSHLAFFGVTNLLMLVMVGRGVLHLRDGALAGIGELLLGTVVLVCMPWIQHGVRDANPNWAMPLLWVVLMGAFALYAYFGMVNPFI